MSLPDLPLDELRRYQNRRSRPVDAPEFWAGTLALVGPFHFLFLYAVPMVFANIVQMSYIATNHLLCDETCDVNDPLANSMSVSAVLRLIADWTDMF